MKLLKLSIINVSCTESFHFAVSSSHLLYFLALFLDVSECIVTNAKGAKKPEQSPDSFFGKGVLSAENAVTWLRNISRA